MPHIYFQLVGRFVFAFFLVLKNFRIVVSGIRYTDPLQQLKTFWNTLAGCEASLTRKDKEENSGAARLWKR
jgi:hypothetical protein